MLLKTITLQNFRNFSQASFKFPSQTTVIVGPNTSGKTNMLEAIYLLATGKSFRANIEEEMIETGKEFARVSGIVGNGVKLEVVLTRVGRKKLTINKIAKRLMDFQGAVRVVLFGPWDLNLITDAPSARRKFLDSVLSQVDREYRRATLSYEKGLRARNKLLERIRDEGLSRAQLLFWDRLIIRNGDYISRKREELIGFVNSTPPLGQESFELVYDKSAISQARLDQYAEEEVAAGATLVGPHRDDIIFKLKAQSSKLKADRDLSIYGSRGEQRMSVLWLKLAELAFVEKITEEKPVLLLDDILSELDHKHREIVMQIIQRQRSPAPYGAGQTIITTADPHTVAGLKDIERVELI